MQYQQEYRLRCTQAAAAVGDYAAAVDHAAAFRPLLTGLPQLARALGEGIADMILPDAPAHPLTRLLTLPRWGGVSERQLAAINNRPIVADLMQIQGTVQDMQQYGDWLVREAMLALEAGDVALARRRLTDAVGPAAPRLTFRDRALAQSWLALWD
jgi:hypothetical protein